MWDGGGGELFVIKRQVTKESKGIVDRLSNYVQPHVFPYSLERPRILGITSGMELN